MGQLLGSGGLAFLNSYLSTLFSVSKYVSFLSFQGQISSQFNMFQFRVHNSLTFQLSVLDSILSSSQFSIQHVSVVNGSKLSVLNSTISSQFSLSKRV